jgi:CheY-like chemotaxis protein
VTARHVSGFMLPEETPPTAPLRVLCLEDNPLIVMHLEQMIEDSGHLFVAALESFSELKEQLGDMTVDCVLVDIDLADGRTGPDAAVWLSDRGIPALFVTGQESLARDLRHLVVGVVAKPVSIGALKAGLEQIVSRRPAC